MIQPSINSDDTIQQLVEISEDYELSDGGIKSKINTFLCRIGFHNWSANRCGVRICQRCPAVDRYFGLTGLLRYKQEKDTGLKESDEQLREMHDNEANEPEG